MMHKPFHFLGMQTRSSMIVFLAVCVVVSMCADMASGNPEPPSCYIVSVTETCISLGSIQGSLIGHSDVSCSGRGLSFWLEGSAWDTGGRKKKRTRFNDSVLCPDEIEYIDIPGVTVQYRWSLYYRKDSGYEHVTSGGGRNASHTASEVGSYKCVFTAYVSRECKPSDRTVVVYATAYDPEITTECSDNGSIEGTATLGASGACPGGTVSFWMSGDLQDTGGESTTTIHYPGNSAACPDVVQTNTISPATVTYSWTIRDPGGAVVKTGTGKNASYSPATEDSYTCTFFAKANRLCPPTIREFEVSVSAFTLEIKTVDGSSDPIPELCIEGQKLFKAVVMPEIPGSFSWSTSSGKMTLIGVGTDLVTVDAGILPSATPDDENLRVGFTPDGGSEICFAEIDLTIFSVEAVSVDITDDIAPAEVLYNLLPHGGVLSACTFTAPGTTEARVDVSGEFVFNFNQSDLASGANTLALTFIDCTKNVTATKTPVPRGPASEITILWMLLELGAPPIPWPVTHEILAERYYRFTYDIPVIENSHTLYIGSSDVMVEADGSVVFVTLDEEHRYTDEEGTYFNKDMTFEAGPTLPPTTPWRRFFASSDAKFMKPGKGLEGIAKIESISFDSSGLHIFPILINNDEVDQNLE